MIILVVMLVLLGMNLIRPPLGSLTVRAASNLFVAKIDPMSSGPIAGAGDLVLFSCPTEHTCYGVFRRN